MLDLVTLPNEEKESISMTSKMRLQIDYLSEKQLIARKTEIIKNNAFYKTMSFIQNPALIVENRAILNILIVGNLFTHNSYYVRFHFNIT